MKYPYLLDIPSFSVVSLLALWSYPSSGIILSNSFILSISLVLLYYQ